MQRSDIAADQTQRTIDDFGDQWTRYTTNDGYYASLELFRDVCGPVLDPSALEGATVSEIGSGTGRIVAMLVAAGAARVIAIEPSDAFEVLKVNTASFADRIEYVRGAGEAVPAGRNLDYVFSIGVLHHIYDPAPVVRAAHAALRPGGRMLVWLYGREGNESYLRLVEPLRKVTVRLPQSLLAAICYGLNLCLALYILLCRVFPLPLRGYMNNVIGRFSWAKRYLVIYDQLNPTVARYYTREQAEALLADGGFVNIRLHHRHGYSWTVIGERPGG
ncbi:MAG: methyltransferase domain-containing protein [Alphaproteobacteria bacterium]|nr:methyltransferase domain-containing protein [Alphaproteobacteria bacterium]